MKLYTPPIRIILADDHELFRDGFSAMLKKQDGIELVGEAKDGEELLKLTKALQPDVIVTDILMPGMNGIEATKKILHEFPQMAVIALSMSNDDNLLVLMMEAGAHGYLLKNAHKDEIIEAIKAVHRGNKYYCKNTTTKLTRMLTCNNIFPNRQAVRSLFSEKEIAIVKLICKEFSSREIADELNHSIRTIDSYRKNILKKMKVKNVTGIVKYAIKHKIYIQDEVA